MTPAEPLSVEVPASCAEQAEAFLNRCSQRFKRQLNESFSGRQDSLLIQAMRYACLDGGKRFRPGLVYASSEVLATPVQCADVVACAVELIHTYSLIHDDLPAMDNDDVRRGRPTVHKAFDEATAILAGDALHDMAFEIISKTRHLKDEQKIRVLQILSATAGTEGMSGGQMLDIVLTDQEDVDERQIERMHRLKTGSLIQACVQMTIACTENVEQETMDALSAYARNVGLGFQLRDDILDVCDDKKNLTRPNYALIFGLRKAEQKLEALLRECCACLAAFPEQRRHNLMQLTRYTGMRNW